jgi:hypothetical protein
MSKSVELAIRGAYGCKYEYLESVAVAERVEGKVVWKGAVQVYQLFGHPKAQKVYGWCYDDGRVTHCTTVLAIPPVDSPQAAVKMAMASKGKK